MATLIKCPTCSHQVADNAAACPRCGSPLRAGCSKSKAYRWVFVGFGAAFVLSGVVVILKGIQSMSLKGSTSISSDFTTPAAVLFCVGVFCAIAPFCKKG